MKKQFILFFGLAIGFIACSKNEPTPAVDYSVHNQKVLKLAEDFESLDITRLEIEGIQLKKLSSGVTNTYNYAYNYKPAAKVFINMAAGSDDRVYVATSVNGNYVPVTSNPSEGYDAATNKYYLMLSVGGQEFVGEVGYDFDDTGEYTRITGQPTDGFYKFKPVNLNSTNLGTSANHMPLINALNRNNFNGEARPLLPIPSDLQVLSLKSITFYFFEGE